MFRCEVTGKLSKPGEKCHKITVEKRQKVYYKWVFNEDRDDWEEVEAAKGWEIVHEISATKEGVAKWNELQSARQGGSL